MTTKRYWPVLAIALLTFPVCSRMQERPAMAQSVVACVHRVPPPSGATRDGTRTIVPPIPAWVPSQIDSVPVTLVHGLRCEGMKVVGCFTYASRKIELEDTLSAYNRWLVLRHEIVHSALNDRGLRFRDAPTEDAVADAMALQQMVEMEAGWPR